MSKIIYKTQRIDALLPSRSKASVPLLYIKGDDQFDTLNAHYDGRIPIKIMGTGSGYDGIVTYASVKPSALAGGFRPNFQALTGWVCLIPEIQWQGYPPYNGEVHILYTPGEVEIQPFAFLNSTTRKNIGTR